ncbi:IclR family transcriptional regulator [Pusillimonas sp. MFBS29]|uniref:IclR family transcriptional regulator n=1 Tax=Pusillimonas sp. MFBS29 TaxID=2886690 RepID=UPI001D1268E4|nr:IclR family transcriptional regulator [Pusillimonas sp. MFBS29]MCC2597015.1 IclR family transcriptional regulator [Pusillimonas sp. MFBS29]
MSENRQGPLERYLSILEIVAASNHSLSLTELSALMNLPKPTIHRLVGVLQKAGALQADDARQRGFRIGTRMWRILQLGQDQDVVTNYAQIVCDRLTERIRETCYAVKLGVDAVHTIARSVPDQGYRLHVYPGEELPPHAAASAKAILAYQDEKVLDAILHEPLVRLTDKTKTTISEAHSELERVREQGYAVCNREIDWDIMAFGCPVFLDGAGVLYSLGVTGPCSRLEQQPVEHWVEALQEGARQFANLLSGARP